MSTPFGPRLIGEAEKTLSALLRQFLQGTELTEPQWVTLRLADLLDGTVGCEGLVAAVADRAQFVDAEALVRELAARGLLADGRLTMSGQQLVASISAAIDAGTAPIWDNLPAGDVAATTRLLNEVVHRTRAVLR